MILFGDLVLFLLLFLSPISESYIINHFFTGLFYVRESELSPILPRGLGRSNVTENKK